MKGGPVWTPGYRAETAGQLPPGGKLKHVDLVAAGRLVDLADPRRCRQIRTQLASRNGEILFAGQFVGDRKPDTRCTKSGFPDHFPCLRVKSPKITVRASATGKPAGGCERRSGDGKALLPITTPFHAWDDESAAT